MNNIKEVVSDILSDFLKEKDLEIYHIEFKREGKNQVLRVYIDKNDGYISTDECEMVSNYLSDELDKINPIDTEYLLEVSSPGMDRVLFLPSHFEKYKNEMVDCHINYDMKDGPFKGKRVVTGKLLGLTDGNIEILVTYDTKEKNRKPGAKVGKGSLSEIKYSFKEEDTVVRLSIIF